MARSGAFGNDNVGFIRVRRRSLTPYWEHSATASASYDIVRAVRIDGKPRHVFVLGLGSLKDVETRVGAGRISGSTPSSAWSPTGSRSADARTSSRR
jgi:hypothetical protein